MINKIKNHLKSRENKRLSQLSNLDNNLDYHDYQKIQNVFSDDYLYYSSYEFFMTDYEKKHKGLSYIPEWILFFMIDKTVKNWLNNNNSLVHISILDPCCGTGNFTQILIEYLLIKFIKIFPDKNKNELLNQIIQNNIYSWDIDINLVLICKNRIKNIFNIEPILVSNVNPLLEDKKFDIIIGNPLYGDLLSDKFKKDINCEYNNIIFDLLDWSYNSIYETGEICFITPHELSYSIDFELWRKKTFNNLSLHKVVDIDASFLHIKQDNIILFLNKQNNIIINTSSFKDLQYEQSVPYHLFYNSKFYYKMIIYWDKEYQKIQDTFPSFKDNQINKYIYKDTIENYLNTNYKNDKIEYQYILFYLYRYVLNNAFYQPLISTKLFKEIPFLK